MENLTQSQLLAVLRNLPQDIVAPAVANASAPTKVLVIGGGGREHALAWKLSQSPRVEHVFVAPGNGGTASEAGMSNAVVDLSAVGDFVKANGVGFVVVGPEQPLVDGLVDELRVQGIPCFGPSAAAARLEASKAFSKEFMERSGIPTARFGAFTDYAKAKAYLDAAPFPKVVIKASGLAAGKGVLMPQTPAEAQVALKQVMVDHAFGDAGDEVVIEECLEGDEVSLLAFCDGKGAVVCMPAAQDHKRIFDGDQGPNTGGMGAYAPAPVLTAALTADAHTSVIQKTVNAMMAEGTPYTGVLYAGLMLTADGPRVLEYNCRFGDPETQVLMMLLKSDLFDVMEACVDGTLGSLDVQWHGGSAATVVGASSGYPGSYPKGKAIEGLDALEGGDAKVFHAGTRVSAQGAVETCGGRVLAVSARGASLPAAVEAAYAGVKQISFGGMQYRQDIAARALSNGAAAPIRLGVLASTRGTSLQGVIDAIASGELPASIEVVVSNKADAGVIARAEAAGLKTVHVPQADGQSREDHDGAISAAFEEHGVELILLVGYMRILSKSFTDKWNGRLLNVHPSLLPAFAGGMDAQVHEAVIAAGVKESGCTVHYVTHDVDGGPILVQSQCEVLSNDTGATLKDRVQTLEKVALVDAVRRHCGRSHGRMEGEEKVGDYAITYKDAGVDITAGNELIDKIKPHCKSTRRPGCDADLGGFGGMFDLAAAGFSRGDGAGNPDDTVLVACTDGVGTKLKIAQMAGKHDTVGIDLVAMSVNDLIVQGAEPLFFLDYFACGKLDKDVAADVVKGIAAGCVDSGCGLIGGETAEMPSMYPDGEYDLAGFSVGAVKRGAILPKPFKSGDKIIGLMSSGVHSNGFSLVRKVIEKLGLSYDDDAPFQPGTRLVEALLEPTRIYVKCLLPLLKANLVSAMAHITGGGLVENIPRVLPADMMVRIKEGSWDMPPVFQWLFGLNVVPPADLWRTFNCGIGMVLVVSEEDADKVIESLATFGEVGAKVIGVVEACAAGDEQVIIE